MEVRSEVPAGRGHPGEELRGLPAGEIIAKATFFNPALSISCRQFLKSQKPEYSTTGTEFSLRAA
jgi:hypothetical protein